MWSCFRLRGALAVRIPLLSIDRVLRDRKFGQRDEKKQPWHVSIIVLSPSTTDSELDVVPMKQEEQNGPQAEVCLMGSTVPKNTAVSVNNTSDCYFHIL